MARVFSEGGGGGGGTLKILGGSLWLDQGIAGAVPGRVLAGCIACLSGGRASCPEADGQGLDHSVFAGDSDCPEVASLRSVRSL